MPQLFISEEIAARIRSCAVRMYPHECCGALLGREGDAGREVLELLPLANRRDDSPENRFALTADDVRDAERAARERMMELVGWYHSHPDHPARPSEFDREHAWPWYSYVIVGVELGQAGEMTSWRLAADRAEFQPEEIDFAFARTRPVGAGL